MRLILLIVNITIAVNVIHGTFVNPYPKFKSYNDGGDPGDALYLTKYIESGDIEKVSFLWLFILLAKLRFGDTTSFKILNKLEKKLIKFNRKKSNLHDF